MIARTMLLLVAAMLFTPFGMSALAQEVPGGLLNGTDDGQDQQQMYDMDDIAHAFISMEPYAIFDEARNLSFSVGALEDPLVTELDVQIANDFARHSNEIIGIASTIGPTGNVNEGEDHDDSLQEALIEFRNGGFRSLFVEQTGSTTKVFADTASTPTYLEVYTASKTTDVQWYAPYIGLTYCGGGFTMEHPIYDEDVWTGDSEPEMRTNIANAGFNRPHPWSYENWNKVSSSYPVHLCADGAFRDEVKIREDNQYNFEPQEPNPDVWNYVPPTFWWGLYVWHWHDWNNSQPVESPPSYIRPPI